MADAGCSRVHSDVIQPAAPFLRRFGESVRGTLLSFGDENGLLWCLRPEMTIPVCRTVIAHEGPRRAWYLGRVFRRRRGGGWLEGAQLGAEFFERDDEGVLDGQIAVLAVRCARAAGLGALRVVVGDAGLASALVEALPLAPSTRRWLLRHAGRRGWRKRLGQVAAPSDAGALAAALAAVAPAARGRVLADMLDAAGIEPVGSRPLSDIAERLVEQAQAAPSAEAAAALEALVELDALEGRLDETLAAGRALVERYGLDADRVLGPVEARVRRVVSALEAAKVDVRVHLGLRRPLAYYSGVVFEVFGSDGTPLGGGGRYDGLVEQLGGPPWPAAGFALDVAALRGAARGKGEAA